MALTLPADALPYEKSLYESGKQELALRTYGKRTEALKPSAAPPPTQLERKITKIKERTKHVEKVVPPALGEVYKNRALVMRLSQVVDKAPKDARWQIAEKGQKKTLTKSDILKILSSQTASLNTYLYQQKTLNIYYVKLKEAGFIAYTDEAGDPVIVPPEGMSKIESVYIQIKLAPDWWRFKDEAGTEILRATALKKVQVGYDIHLIAEDLKKKSGAPWWTPDFWEYVWTSTELFLKSPLEVGGAYLSEAVSYYAPVTPVGAATVAIFPELGKEITIWQEDLTEQRFQVQSGVKYKWDIAFTKAQQGDYIHLANVLGDTALQWGVIVATAYIMPAGISAASVTATTALGPTMLGFSTSKVITAAIVTPLIGVMAYEVYTSYTVMTKANAEMDRLIRERDIKIKALEEESKKDERKKLRNNKEIETINRLHHHAEKEQREIRARAANRLGSIGAFILLSAGVSKIPIKGKTLPMWGTEHGARVGRWTGTKLKTFGGPPYDVPMYVEPEPFIPRWMKRHPKTTKYYETKLVPKGARVKGVLREWGPKGLISKAWTKFKREEVTTPIEYHEPAVVRGERRMSLVKTVRGEEPGLTMQKTFRAAVDPKTGRLTLTSAVPGPLKTTLRTRVTAVIETDKGTLLMSHTKHGKKTYMLPGGDVNPHESLKMALQREIMEELGVKVISSNKIGNVIDYNSGNNYIVFKVKIKGTPLLKGETTGLSYYKTSEVSKMGDFRNIFHSIKENPNIKHVVLDFDETLAVRMYSKGKMSTSIRPGAIEFLSTLKKDGYIISLMSLGKKAHILAALKKSNLTNYFKHIKAGSKDFPTGLKDIRTIKGDVLIDNSYTQIANVRGHGRLGIKIEPFYGKGRYAWHVDEIMYGVKTSTLKTTPIPTQAPWAKDIVVGKGESPDPGLWLTRKGKAPTFRWQMGKPPTDVKYTYTKKPYKPALVEVQYTPKPGSIQRAPKWARKDAGKFKAWMEYWRKQDPSVRLIVPSKTEIGAKHYGLLEEQMMFPPGTGLRAKPIGFKPGPSLTKWQKYWAEKSGYYKSYRLMGQKIPVRMHEPYVLKRPSAPATARMQKRWTKQTDIIVKQQQAYHDYYYKGIIQRSYAHPSYWSPKLAKATAYTTPYKAYKPSYKESTYVKPSYSRPVYSKPSYPKYYPSKRPKPSYPTYYKKRPYPRPYPRPYSRPYPYPYPYPYPRPYPYPYKPIITPVPPPPTPPPKLGKRKIGKHPHDAYVKRDATRTAKYIKATKSPLASRKQALGAGAVAVDRTVSRTFYVKPSDKKPISQPRYAHDWMRLKHKYRKPIKKGKPQYKSNKWIEKTTHAIDSKGELEGITFKGLVQLQKLRATGQIPKKGKPKFKPKPYKPPRFELKRVKSKGKAKQRKHNNMYKGR